jgi:hypothetical protein
VAFHVEIARSLQHARVFNLGEDELRAQVVEPWNRGEVVRLGGRDWDPRRCGLTILEGPRLAGPELAHGQGWHHARRSARPVTSDVLRAAVRPATLAVLAGGAEAQRLAAAVADELGVAPVRWHDVRAALIAGAPAGVDTALVIGDDSTAAFDVGLVVGALGRRAVVAWLGRPGPGLDGLDVAALDSSDPTTVRALAELLRAALDRRPR